MHSNAAIGRAFAIHGPGNECRYDAIFDLSRSWLSGGQGTMAIFPGNYVIIFHFGHFLRMAANVSWRTLITLQRIGNAADLILNPGSFSVFSDLWEPKYYAGQC